MCSGGAAALGAIGAAPPPPAAVDVDVCVLSLDLSDPSDPPPHAGRATAQAATNTAAATLTGSPPTAATTRAT